MRIDKANIPEFIQPLSFLENSQAIIFPFKTDKLKLDDSYNSWVRLRNVANHSYRMSVRPFKTCWFLTLLTTIFYVISVSYSYDFLNYWFLNKVQSYKRRYKQVLKMLVCPKHYRVCIQYCNKLSYNFLSTSNFFLLFQFWPSTGFNVRLSYLFRDSLLWIF